MKYLTFICLCAVLSTKTSAYDIFQGLLKLGKPCFPTQNTNGCNVTLVERYPVPVRTQNPPTTAFFLFTTQSPNKAELLHECGGALPPHTTFNPRHPTEIFIHGAADGVCRSGWMREMKEQLYLKGNYNVILVDWSWGNFPEFAAPTLVNSKAVAYQLAIVIRNIARKTNTCCRKFHIVGHSYGALMAGLAGKMLIKEKCKLGRITGLDNFVSAVRRQPKEDRLSPNDASFVDVIHVCDGECFPPYFGEPSPLGHVDFYVNDGTHQYSCYPYAVESLLKLDVLYGLESLLLPTFCFHLHAVQYYKVSINAEEEQFVGVECANYEDFKSGKCSRHCEEGKCMVMGMDTPRYFNASDNKRRTYFVPTTLYCPYVDHSGFTGLPLKKRRKIRNT